MKFVTAVSALAAADFASAEGPHRSLGDFPRAWPQAVKSIANSGRSNKVNHPSSGNNNNNGRVLPDNGKVLPNLRVNKLNNLANSLSEPAANQKQREENEAPDSDIPDFGILASISSKNKGNKILKDGVNRRMEDLGDMVGDIVTEMITNPLGATVGLFCMYGAAFCESCEVVSTPRPGEEDAYSAKIDCPALATYGMDTSDVSDSFNELQTMCSDYGICESCGTDDKNFLLDFQGCNDGGSKIMMGAVGDLEGFLAYAGQICDLEEAKNYCTTCEVNFEYGEDGSKTGTYSLNLDCPTYPETYPGEIAEGLSYLENFCTTYGICETCNVGTDKFLIDMQSCNIANAIDGIIDAAIDAALGEEPIETDPVVEEEPATPATEEPIETDPVVEEEPATPATEEPIETDPVVEEEPATPATEEPIETDPVVEEEPATPATEEPIETAVEEEPATPAVEGPIETAVEEEPATPETEDAETGSADEETVTEEAAESRAYSFGPKPNSSAGLVLLTLATVSFAQVLLG